jgi:hypothetical protein
MNVEPPETFVIIESIVYKSNGFAIVENKATNPISVRVLNIAFDFCFRRVTEEGYKGLS